MPKIGQVKNCQQETRRERLAVNVFDLDRVEPLVRQMLLGGKLNLTEPPLRLDKNRVDEVAVPFSCSLVTAGAIADMLRSHDAAAGDYPTRIYVYKRAWSKVPGTLHLTVVEEGKVKLNPAVFVEEVELAEAVPPPPQVATGGVSATKRAGRVERNGD